MRITANMVTITRIVLMPIPGYLLYGGANQLMVALFAIIILGLTDWIDGIMARREGATVLGGLLDPIADKIFIAVIYLPLTEMGTLNPDGVIPLWITITIFVRDFLVTTLRSSLSLRGAPMRTSTIAKYKTAMQMQGIGYVILYTAYPEAWFAWAMIISPVVIALGLMGYRFVKKQKQGKRSWTLFVLTFIAVIYRWQLGAEWAITITLWIIVTMTIVSGFSYLADAWSALKGQSGSIKEIARFTLDGVLVPTSVLLLLNYTTFFPHKALISVCVILIIVLELAVGGLGNLLAQLKRVPRMRWIAVKSTTQILLATTAFHIAFKGMSELWFIGEVAMVAALAVTIVYCCLSFYIHRSAYLTAL